MIGADLLPKFIDSVADRQLLGTVLCFSGELVLQ